MNKQSFIPHPKYRQAGLTLVELMVALVISLLLIAGTITIFSSNKQAYRLNEASSRVQENGRFALSFLRNDVRMAGFVGCLSKNLSEKLVNRVDTSKYDGTESDIANIVGGFDGTNYLRGYTIPSGGLPNSSDLYINGLRTDDTAEGKAVPGTDAFIVTQGGSCEGGSVNFVLPTPAANVKIVDAGSCGIVQESVVLISDCENADMFRVVSNPVSGSDKDSLSHTISLNTGNTLSKAYGLDADVYTLTNSIYYIGYGASGEPALFRRIYSGAVGDIKNEELVEGVESMLITYGIDTDGNGSANFYANATTVDADATNWTRVNSARIRLTVRSNVQNVVQSTAITDRRLRHTFTETIKIRNKI